MNEEQREELTAIQAIYDNGMPLIIDGKEDGPEVEFKALGSKDFPVWKSIIQDKTKRNINENMEILEFKMRFSIGITNILVPGVVVVIAMPREYPMKYAPILCSIKEFPGQPSWISFKSSSLSNLKRHNMSDLEAELGDLFVVGSGALYSWIEFLREYLREWLLEAMDNISGLKEKFSIENEPNEPDSRLKEPEVIANSINNSISANNLPKIYHSSEPLIDRKSTFEAHCAQVYSVEDVDAVMEYLLSQNKIRRATHNILAYRIARDVSGRNTILQDYDDDGESGAGKKLMKLLEFSKLENVMVVVSRWFGGILLGPDRFKHINNCARSLLRETEMLS